MKRSHGLWLALVLLMGVSIQFPARAWHAAGHSMVASVAFRTLPAADREAIVALLRHHQDFDRLAWQAGANGSGLPNIGEYFFMRAATWPDEVRPKKGHKSPEHHGSWHFVNGAIDIPGSMPHALKPRPARNLFETDILAAITLCRSIAAAPNATPEDKAKAISWIIHLVGDIHQPLHAVALLSDDFPNGDQGGNLFLIQPSRGATELHGYWDGLYDELRSPGPIHSRAGSIATAHPANLRPEVSDLRPSIWAGESEAIARSFAYFSRGVQLKPGKTEALPEHYEQDALTQADPRIAVGGYRLAAILSRTLKPGPKVDPKTLAAFRHPASVE